MDNKQKGWLWIILFSVYTIFIGIKYNDILAMINSASIFESLAWYFVLNAQYLMIVYGFYVMHEQKFKAVIASLFIVVATNIVSSPRLPLTSVDLSHPEVILNIGTFFMKPLTNFGLQWVTAWWLVYAAIPIALFMIALTILGYNPFSRRT